MKTHVRRSTQSLIQRELDSRVLHVQLLPLALALVRHSPSIQFLMINSSTTRILLLLRCVTLDSLINQGFLLEWWQLNAVRWELSFEPALPYEVGWAC